MFSFLLLFDLKGGPEPAFAAKEENSQIYRALDCSQVPWVRIGDGNLLGMRVGIFDVLIDRVLDGVLVGDLGLYPL